MKTKICLLLFVSTAMFTASCSSQQTAQQKQENPNVAHSPTANANQSHHGHDSHLAEVNERGDRAMGFSHQKTTHHFRLFENGGAIEVGANDTNDAASREQIRTHLQHISQMFPAGDFNAPMLTHGKTPPGVPILQRLKAEISYKFEEMPNGGRVRILTHNPEALGAIHDFLRFQISDHQTGDSADIAKQ